MNVIFHDFETGEPKAIDINNIETIAFRTPLQIGGYIEIILRNKKRTSYRVSELDAPEIIAYLHEHEGEYNPDCMFSTEAVCEIMKEARYASFISAFRDHMDDKTLALLACLLDYDDGVDDLRKNLMRLLEEAIS